MLHMLQLILQSSSCVHSFSNSYSSSFIHQPDDTRRGNIHAHRSQKNNFTARWSILKNCKNFSGTVFFFEITAKKTAKTGKVENSKKSFMHFTARGVPLPLGSNSPFPGGDIQSPPCATSLSWAPTCPRSTSPSKPRRHGQLLSLPPFAPCDPHLCVCAWRPPPLGGSFGGLCQQTCPLQLFAVFFYAFFSVEKLSKRKIVQFFFYLCSVDCGVFF